MIAVVTGAAGFIGSTLAARLVREGHEVRETIAQIHGNPLKIERGPEVPGDVGRTGGSIELIRTELEWIPRVSVEEGLRRQYEGLRSAT